MSEMTNKVTTKHEIRGEVQVTKVYPELENLTVTPTKAIQSFNHPDSYGYNNVMVKAIDCKTLNVNPSKEQQAFDGMYDKVNVSAINCETLNITPRQENQVFNGMYDKVNVNAIQADTLKVTPSKSEQSFKGLYEQVNVNAIQADTLNIKPTNQTQTYNGLYETVNVEKMHGDTLEITPTEETQTFNGMYENINVNGIGTEEVIIDPDFSKQNTVVATATAGKYLKKATINKDTNLVPQNILQGVNIYGIGGTATSGIDTSDATATAQDIVKDKTAYVNGEKVVGTLEVNGGFDTSQIVDCEKLFYGNTTISDLSGLDISNATTTAHMCRDCTSLETVPQLNTSKSTAMGYMFSGCTNLKNLPFLDGSSTTGLAYYVSSCPNLTDESLNNVMLTCISAVNIKTSSYKKLKSIGLSSAQATRCKSLSNYQALTNAGWITGY